MDWRGWSINITDAHDRPVLSVLFPQALDLASQWTLRKVLAFKSRDWSCPIRNVSSWSLRG